jgi:hypothetical protein
LKYLLPRFLKASASSSGVGAGVLCGGGTGTSPLLLPFTGTVPLLAAAGGEEGVGCGGEWERFWEDCAFWTGVGEDGLAAPDVTPGVSRSVSMEVRFDMAESRERRLRSSGGRLRGWVLGSIFRRRDEDEDEGTTLLADNEEDNGEPGSAAARSRS